MDKKYTRIEVINHSKSKRFPFGVSIVKDYTENNIIAETSEQDGGKTLKIFLSDRKDVLDRDLPQSQSCHTWIDKSKRFGIDDKEGEKNE